MSRFKLAILLVIIFLLPGCAAVPMGIGLIPGAPAYVSSLIGGGQTMYATAVDERTTEQQMLDAIIAGHAQAELFKNKEIRADQITCYAYFGKLYLVGEYTTQKQLHTIYECVSKVDNKQAVISRLYLEEPESGADFIDRQATEAELRAQLMTDLKVTSTPIEVEIVQGDIILLGAIKNHEERECIMAHARKLADGHRVISYLYHLELSGPAPKTMMVETPEAEENKTTAAIDKLPPPPPVPNLPTSKKKTTRKKVTRLKPEEKAPEPVVAESYPASVL